MPKHSYFEELCALAALGDLSAQQAREFEAHRLECDQCRQLAAEHLELQQVLVGAGPDRTEIEGQVEASRSRVKAAMWQSIARVDQGLPPVVSIADRTVNIADRPDSPIAGRTLPQPAKAARGFRVPLWIGAGAAAVLIFWLGGRYDQRIHSVHPGANAAASSPAQTKPAQQVAADLAAQRVAAQNRDLSTALTQERQQNHDLQQQLASDDQQLAKAIAAEESLREEIDRQAAMVKATQADLDQKKAALAQAQSQVQAQVQAEAQAVAQAQAQAESQAQAQLEAAKSSNADQIASLEFQVKALTSQLNQQDASLNRERDLLSHGREIRDIIGARNLHIIDVYDTDTGGATKKPFARAFYTEGRSLVYYAYDLPQRKVDEGKFSYVAWGENNGRKQSIKKIGILFHDDQTQKRWSLNFSDPGVLKEIDSVFITLERTDQDVAEPKGKRMLTAYLGTPPNHP